MNNHSLELFFSCLRFLAFLFNQKAALTFGTILKIFLVRFRKDPTNGISCPRRIPMALMLELITTQLPALVFTYSSR